MSFASFTIQEGAVDYVTATAQSGDRGDALTQLGTRILDQAHVESWDVKPWRFHGYEGLQSGPVIVATRQDSTLIKLSSVYASEFWFEVLQLSSNCSRLDTQVTVKLDGPAQDAMRVILKSIRQFRKTNKGGPVLKVITEEPGGVTIYLGKRQSDRFGRIYDKGAESQSEHYRDCLRFEVQWQNKLARIVGQELVQFENKFPNNRSKLRHSEAIRGYVFPYFIQRGLPKDFAPARQSLVTSARPGTNPQRQLEWLRSQVSPTVDDLISRGMAYDVAESLFACESLRPMLEAMGQRLKVCYQRDVCKTANSNSREDPNGS